MNGRSHKQAAHHKDPGPKGDISKQARKRGLLRLSPDGCWGGKLTAS